MQVWAYLIGGYKSVKMSPSLIDNSSEAFSTGCNAFEDNCLPLAWASC